MDLAADILRQLDNPTLTANERALIRCEAAAGLIHAGQYEAAREALGELWAAVGERPNLEGLKQQATIVHIPLESDHPFHCKVAAHSAVVTTHSGKWYTLILSG